MKALVLCSGLGVRLRPLTNKLNKNLLPIANKPMVLYSVDHAIALNLRHLIFIYNELGKDLPLIVNNYLQDQYPNLPVKTEFILDTSNSNLGIAYSMLLAKDKIKHEDFIVFFGDVLYEFPQIEHLQKFNKLECEAAFLLDSVENPQRYASVVFENGKIKEIIEKCPDPALNNVVLSLDIYTKSAWRYLENLKPSQRGELEITDLRNLLVKNHFTTYSYVKGYWIDAGTHESYKEANEFFGKT